LTVGSTSDGELDGDDFVGDDYDFGSDSE